MSDVILPVSSDWLALREAEDARARSRDLATAAAALLARRPGTIHDLGSGTGSMMRWLAPHLPGPQTWVLHDWNDTLLRRALEGDRPLDPAGHPVAVSSRIGSLADFRAQDLMDAGLVTASALLDVLTLDEVHAVVRACTGSRTPALFSLSVTGRVDLNPPGPRDREFEAAFNAHQQRTAADRRLLGPTGAAVAERLFVRAGFRVRSVDTVWRLGADDPRLLGEWLDGWVGAALEQEPRLRVEASADLAALERERYAGELSATIHHTDLLAWPS